MTKSVYDLIPEHIREIEPYVPGKPIEEVERELKVRAVKLASNENPLGPSPLAVEAVRRHVAESNRYPDGGGYYLRAKLAARLGVPREQIILGGGSTELIDLVGRMLLGPGDEGLCSAGSFPLYYIAVRAAGARLVEVPLRDYAYDLDALAHAVTPRTRVIYLSNPNNPTGSFFTADQFDAFLARVPADVMVVLDEAYAEYVEPPGYSRSLELVRRRRNLFVLRTFSKVYGLAGLRVGYGLGAEDVLVEMNKLRSPFNTSSVGQAAALAALDDAEHVRRSLETNRAGMRQLTEGLAALGVRALPSATNFLLVELGREARPVAAEMEKLGVIVRPMRWMGFPGAVRVSIGAAEENEKCLRAMAQVLGAPVAARPEGAAGERGAGGAR
jgi:histidinol-phosphate aminotransferase